jgi:TrwC relaxase
MATFRQTTSRADDPQLHTHAVISAKVQTDDGRWLALDARFLKRHQRMLGGVYQSVLRAELTHRYGVVWGPVVNGQAEIAGAPAELLEVFSKRTVQGRRRARGQGRGVPGPEGTRPVPLGAGSDGAGGGHRHPVPQDWPSGRDSAAPVAGRSQGVGLDR